MPEVLTQEALSGRDLDAAIAERVMGWQRQPDYNYWMSFPAGEPFKLHKLIANWRPSESIEAAMQVEDRIAELNLRKQYLVALGKIVSKAATDAGEIVGYWHFTHATAEQRCRAALTAIESKE